MATHTYTVRIDPDRGLLDARSLRDLLLQVEIFLQGDRVDADDDAAILATNVLIRHFNGPGNDDLINWE